jgi:hypothetical protein
MTLRLLHLEEHDTHRLPAIKRGEVTYISKSNEDLVLERLGQYASTMTAESHLKLKELSKMCDELTSASSTVGDRQGKLEAITMVRKLWEEQNGLARAFDVIYKASKMSGEPLD